MQPWQIMIEMVVVSCQLPIMTRKICKTVLLYFICDNMSCVQMTFKIFDFRKPKRGRRRSHHHLIVVGDHMTIYDPNHGRPAKITYNSCHNITPDCLL